MSSSTFGSCLRLLPHCRSPSFARGPSIRRLSVQAAIDRGIRKTRQNGRVLGAESRNRFPQQDFPRRPFDFSAGRRSNYDPADKDKPRRPSHKRELFAERPRRPNHDQGLDPEDLDQTYDLKRVRRSPAQNAYLAGGARSNGQNLAQRGRDRGNRNISLPSTVETGSQGGLNRADRRALQFPLSPRQTTTRNADRSNWRARGQDGHKNFPRQDAAQDRHWPRAGRARSDDSGDLDRDFHGLTDVPQSSSTEVDTDLGGADYRPRPPYKPPLSVPYTTPASVFLYGTAVVTAALQSQRRKMYKLYVYEGENRESIMRDDQLRRKARHAGVTVIGMRGDQIRLMDKMSSSRPHNGYILEASPLPMLPVESLNEVDRKERAIRVSVGHQSREEAVVNGTKDFVAYAQNKSRFPFVLMLDGILDPGNLGAILRTAYFLGVDAVAISSRNSAPFSAVTLKASAGASEHIPLISLSQPASFLASSLKNGWKVYAGVPPPGPSFSSGGAKYSAAPRGYISCSDLDTSPLRRDPCVLMLGGEGEGLRWNLRKLATHEIGVAGLHSRANLVDSLNVSVAAGLLCDAMLKMNGPRTTQPEPWGEAAPDSVSVERLF